MPLTLAKPQHAAAIVDFYERVHDHTFPHSEVRSEATLRDKLQKGTIAVIIGSHDKRVVGCALGWPKLWNESLEMGAISVEERADRVQVGKKLFDALKKLGTSHYGMATFHVGNKAAFKRVRNMGAQCWGFWTKPGSAGFEGAQLLMGFANPKDEAVRVFPPSNALTSQAFASRLIGIYDDPSLQPMPYPKTYPVGAPRGTGAPVLSGTVWPTYDARTNTMTIESLAGPFPDAMLREFMGKLRKKNVRDVRLNLPVNQDQAYLELLDLGFKPVAYLPGWFLKGPYRYDCVQMVTGLGRVRDVPDEFVRGAIEKILGGFGVS